MEEISFKVFLLLAGSGICSAFVGLQSIGVALWIQPLLLLQFLHHGKILGRKWSSIVGLLLLTLLTQTLGYTIAYAGEFNDPYFTFSGMFTVFAMSVLVWAILIFVFLSAVVYEHRFPAAVSAHPFAFAAVWTMAWHTASSFAPIGSTGNPAYTQYAIQPMVMTVALWGLEFITFFMAFTCSLVHQRLMLRQEAGQSAWTVTTGGAKGSGHQNGNEHKLETEDNGGDHIDSEGSRVAASGKSSTEELAKKVRTHDKLVRIWISVLLINLLYCGGTQVLFSGTFFQKGIIETTKPAVGVSCILHQPNELLGFEGRNMDSLDVDGSSRNFLWNATAERARAGDAFIMWSEAAAVVNGPKGEDELFSEAQAILSLEQERRGQHKLRQWTDQGSLTGDHGPYLGLSYEMVLENKKLGQAASVSNVFTLMLPNGSVGFRYEKSYPVPFVEPEVVPGPGKLKAVDTPFGRVGAAICFDLEFPLLMKQASYLGVDIMLQPSWTWGPMATNQLKADSFRAVENGFTLMRCSSMGQSAVVTPFNEIIDLRESTESSVVTMQLPLASRIWTIFPYGGFLFGILVATAAAKFLFMAWLPLSWVLAMSNILPGAVNTFFVGENFEEEMIGRKTYRRYKTKTRSASDWTVARRPSLLVNRSPLPE